MMTGVELNHEYARTACRCGGTKRAGHPFCLVCYKTLPQQVTAGLRKRFGKGYEQAYLAACKYIGLECEPIQLGSGEVIGEIVGQVIEEARSQGPECQEACT